MAVNYANVFEDKDQHFLFLLTPSHTLKNCRKGLFECLIWSWWFNMSFLTFSFIGTMNKDDKVVTLN